MCLANETNQVIGWGWVLAYGKYPKCYSNSWSAAKGTNLVSKETITEIVLREKIWWVGRKNLNWLTYFSEIIPGRPDGEVTNQWITCEEMDGRQGQRVAMTTWFCVWGAEPSADHTVGQTDHGVCVWVEGDGGSWQGWWRRGHWEICQGCPGERIRERPPVGKVALPVFFPVAASSPLSVRPACSSGCLAPGTPEEWELVNSWSTSSDFPHPKNKCTRNYGNRFIRTAVENIVIQCLQTNLLDKLGAFRVYLKFEGLWNVPVTIGEIAKQDSSGRVKGSHCGWEEPRGKKGIQLWRQTRQRFKGEHISRAW